MTAFSRIPLFCPKRIAILVGLSASLLVPSAHAVPSFSRQTGASCNLCHTTTNTQKGQDPQVMGVSATTGTTISPWIRPRCSMAAASGTSLAPSVN